MPRRTFVAFWTSVVVSAFLLGGGVATVRRVLAGGTGADIAVLSVTALGLAGSLLVAGRVVLVLARAQRRARER